MIVRKVTALSTGAMMLLFGYSSVVQAGVIYENLPTDSSQEVSWHNTNGPILADDFVPASSGVITKVEWWGSTALSSTWELAFHTNNPDPTAPQPNIDNATQGALVKYLTAAVVSNPTSDPNIFLYTADLTSLTGLGLPQMTVNSGQEYWFTAANASNGWTWAQALNGPTVGSENYNAHSSVGGAGLCLDGGPHCGPWVDVHTDFAFRVTAVPEPATLALFGLGLLGLGFILRRRNSTPSISVA